MRFPIAVWLVTRVVVVAAMAIAAPHAPLAAFGNWDGAWYGSIALHGYDYAPDGARHNVAFFPLFPLAASLLVRLGVPWPLAGTLVANAAFLACAVLLYSYAQRKFGMQAARWCVIVLCASPLSLFCSVAYSEGLFVLCAVLALWAYDRERYLLAGLAAAGASATRPLGTALALALLAACIIERRGLRASLQTALGFAGVGAFMLFCAVHFGDALAFVRAQTAWRHSTGFDPAAWLALLHGAVDGRVHDWITICSIAAAIAGITFYRRKLGVANVAFLLAALAVLALAGTPLSADRNLYAVLPVVLAVALFFQRIPAAGYIITAAALAILALDAVAFAHFQWVA